MKWFRYVGYVNNGNPSKILSRVQDDMSQILHMLLLILYMKIAFLNLKCTISWHRMIIICFFKKVLLHVKNLSQYLNFQCLFRFMTPDETYDYIKIRIIRNKARL